MNDTKSQEKIDGGQTNIFLGTWTGSAFKHGPHEQLTYLGPLILRIHSIDLVAKKIEITEIGYKFETGAHIPNPEKMTCKVRFDGTSLSIELDRSVSGCREIMLTPEYNNEILMLRASVEGDKANETKLAFLVAKSSDDISTFVKPSQVSVEIIPYPVKIDKLDPE